MYHCYTRQSNRKCLVRLRRAVATLIAMVIAAGTMLSTGVPALASNPCASEDPPPRCRHLPPPPPPAPTAASDLKVSGAFTSTATLTWNDNAVNEKDYLVWRWPKTVTKPAGEPGSTQFTLPANSGTGPMTFIDQGLDPNAAYTYVVAAEGAAFGQGMWLTSPVFLPGFPAAPTALSVINGPPYGAMNLSWTRPETGATQIKIYRQNPGYDPRLIGTIGPAATTYVVLGQPWNVTTCYFVSAYNASGETPSNTVCITQGDEPPPPAPAPQITGLSGTPNGSSIVWSWQGHSTDSGYRAHLWDLTVPYLWDTVIVPPVSSNHVTYTTSNLTPGHRYELDVQTQSDNHPDSAGVNSDPVAIPGNGGPPPQPIGYRAVDVYNCSLRGDRTVWESVNGAGWTRVGVAVDGSFCGPGGDTAPLVVALPRGAITLEATDNGEAPNGVDNVTFTQPWIGDPGGAEGITSISS